MKLDRGIWYPDWDQHFAGTDGPKYQHALLKRACDLAGNYGLAIDVGAHVGLWSRRLARRFVRVLAIEPQHENFRCLEENCGHLGNVDMRRVAAGRKESVAHVEPHAKNNSGDFRISGSGQRTEIVSLDSLVDHADLIKIDVQGYEYQVLQGATKILKNSHPVLVVEDRNSACQHYGTRKGDAAKFLACLGYSLVFKTKKDSVYVTE